MQVGSRMTGLRPALPARCAMPCLAASSRAMRPLQQRPARHLACAAAEDRSDDEPVELQRYPSTLGADTNDAFDDEDRTAMQRFLYPDKEELPNDFEMPIWDHLDELRERVLVGALAATVAILSCFCFSKELVVFLEAPVADSGAHILPIVPVSAFLYLGSMLGSSSSRSLSCIQVMQALPFARFGCFSGAHVCGWFNAAAALGCKHVIVKHDQATKRPLSLRCPFAGVRFLQLSPGEFFFTTFKVAGYAGLLLSAPTVLYEIIAYVVPGLTRAERRFLAPVVFGSSILFYAGLIFSYEILTPAALNFFVSYAEGAVESLWSIDQYFEFVLVLMLSTGLSFQVPVIQIMLGQLGIVTSEQMLSQWRYVVVGATIVAAVLTPSTDPFTQALLAAPLVGLYMGGATVVKLIEAGKAKEATA